MNTQRHFCLTLLLAAAPLASAQTPAAPASVEPPTLPDIPGLSQPPPTTPVPLPPEAESGNNATAADEPQLPPAAAVGFPPGKHYPPTPREVQNSLPAPVPVPVSPSPGATPVPHQHYFNGTPYGTPAPTPAAPPRGRADKIIRDTKLKVLQSHYETALSELVGAERALLDATDDKRPAMETKLKGLKGFVEKLESEIKTLAAGPDSDAAAGMGSRGSGPVRERTGRGPRSGAAPGNPGYPKAPYTPRNATGKADADTTSGDTGFAWCPASASAEEWLKLTFEHRVDLAEVRIHENYATGALTRVMALDTSGDGKRLREHVIWEETEPKENTPCVRVIAAPAGVTANGIRLEFDTRRIRTWQEIDAVELVGRDGSRQWASDAEASSYWSGGPATVWRPGDSADDVTRGTNGLGGSGAVTLVAPVEERPAPGKIRVPATRGIIIDRQGRELRLHAPEGAVEAVPAPER